MRAVNLIPKDQRSGSSVGVGRSEGGAYAVLAVLVAVAALAVLYGKAHRDVNSRKTEAATISAKAQRAESEASQLAPYTSFVSLRTQREQAVAALVDSRFDWAHAFHELGRVLTPQTQIATLDGSITSAPATAATAAAASPPAAGATAATAATTAPGAAPAPVTTSATPATSTVSSSTPAGSVPTFILTGCATSQNAVAQMLNRLRLIDGVSEVSLQSSTKGTGGAGACGGPAFSVTVTFVGLPSEAASAAAAKPAAKTVSDTTTTKSTTVTVTNAASGGTNR